MGDNTGRFEFEYNALDSILEVWDEVEGIRGWYLSDGDLVDGEWTGCDSEAAQAAARWFAANKE